MNQVEKNQTIKNWMLSSAAPEAVAAALAFNDFSKRVRPGMGFTWKPPGAVSFARIIKINEGRKKPEILLEITLGSSMPQPEKDDVFFMSPIEVDLVGNEAQASLASLDSVAQLQTVLKIQSNDFLFWLKETVNTAIASQNVIKIPTDENSALLLSVRSEETFSVPRADHPFPQLSKSLGLTTEQPAAKPPAKRSSKASAAAATAALATTPTLPAPSTESPQAEPQTAPITPVSAVDSTVATDDVGPELLKLYPVTSAAPILENLLSAVLLLREEIPVGSVPTAILSDPMKWGLESMEFDPLRERCEAMASAVQGKLFTAAQHQVFSNMLSRRLQCVWGPPGSGKTHFASTAIAIAAQARISEAHENQSPGRPFRVLVTAFTHSSIDNLIEKVIERHKELRGLLNFTTPELPVARLVNKSSATSSRFAELQKFVDAEEEDDETDAPSAADPPVTPGDSSSSPSLASTATPVSYPPPEEESSTSQSTTTEEATHTSSLSSSTEGSTPAKRGRGGKIAGTGKRVARKPASKRPAFPQVNPQIVFADVASEVKIFMSDHQQCVVSGTVWAIRKCFKLRVQNPPEFDLVVIDEASQLLLAHCLEPLKYLLSKTGRLIVAGDHQQLPPIINAEYPQVAPGEPIYHSSIFDYLQSRDLDSSCTDMLFENWRMNSTLCELPSQRIYTSKDPAKSYRPANPEVANRSFYKVRDPSLGTLFRSSSRPHATFNVNSSLLQTVLDASFSMIVVRLSSKSGLNTAPFPHAPLVSAVVGAIRRVCQDEFPSESDFSFWSKRLLVVAPHHIQRQIIRSHLQNTSNEWHWPWEESVSPAIDTVEKAQGREFDTVVIDYGIMDPFRVAREIRFLYNRNRLNVAQSRSRCKCVLFIADNLLELQQDLFRTPAIEAGLSYMQSCVEFAQRKGSLVDLDVDKMDDVVDQMRSEPIFASKSLLLHDPTMLGEASGEQLSSSTSE